MFLIDQHLPVAEQTLVHSASDLVQASACELSLLRLLDARLGRAEPVAAQTDEMLRRAAALGDVHEQEVLADHVATYGPFDPATGRGVRVLDPAPAATREALDAARDETFAALADGADVVSQASFFDGRFHGRADFLVRTDALGAPRYAVQDVKLARRVKVPALLQLAAYADQLLAAGVPVAPDVHLVLGTRERTEHRLADVLPVFRERRARLLDLLDAHRAGGEPVTWDSPGVRRCGRCDACREQVVVRQDVLLVAGLRLPQRATLHAAGIRTVTDLARAETPPPGLTERTFRSLRTQARLQSGLQPVPDDAPGPSGSVTVTTGEPPQEQTLSYVVVDPSALAALPAPDPGDVYFDFEGDPLWSVQDAAGLTWNLDYLFGLVERPVVDDDEPPFRAFWAHDLAEERQALVDFVTYVTERRRRFPGMHVYHYADYERVHLLRIAARHGVCEQEVDDLLRAGVLVDLYAVVRAALKVSSPSYSLKKLEPLYMGDRLRSGDVTDAAASVVAYAEYCALRDAGRDAEAKALLAGIEDYNRYDCVSTLRLHEFLLRLDGPGAEWGDGPGVELGDGSGAELGDGPGAEPGAVGGPIDGAGAGAGVRARAVTLELTDAEVAQRDARAESEALEREVRALAGGPSGASGEGRTADEEAVALLGAGVGYSWREAKPYWQAHFARLKDPVDEWPDPRGAFVVEEARVTEGWVRETPRKNPSRRLVLRGRLPDGSDLKPGYADARALYDEPVPSGAQTSVDGVRGWTGGVEVLAVRHEVVGGRETDVLEVRQRLTKGVAEHDDLPVALVVGPGPRSPHQEEAVRALATRVRESWPDLPGHPAVDVLRRRAPRLASGGPLPAVGDGPDGYVDAVTDAVRDLDRSYLAVQGPPGTGKTYLASRVIGRLVAEGWRVGVVAQSHEVVENVLRGVVTTGGVDPGRVGKKGSRKDVSEVGRAAGDELPDGARLVPWSVVDAPQAFAAEGPCVLGGTAWDFAHPDRYAEDTLDLLVIDEAGQFSLANTIAVSRAAQRLLLLGDPQQLPQVSQGAHPEPVDRSALGWLTDGHDVLPAGLGYFLARSWRMHPELCAAVSELAYEGRLEAEPAAAARHLEGVAPGVHVALVEHTGNAVSSPEEATEVVRQVRAVVGRTWHPGPGSGAGDRPARPLAPTDVIVVAAYNAQVWTVRRALAAAGLDEVRVGTVDIFQGKEAPVVIATLAASSPADVPRGMEFLLSRHRVNVAVSRGQWCAVVVRSPQLTDYLPQRPEHLAELGAFVGLCERGA